MQNLSIFDYNIYWYFTTSQHQKQSIMNTRPISNGTDYRAASKETAALLAAELSTAEGEKPDILVMLIEAYERRHFPLDLPDPVKIIKLKWNKKV
jgi:HTH-type transcriptional regulator/antitoxin HigA